MRKLKINTQERAISTDLNRVQAFIERSGEEFMRMWLLSQSTWESGAGVGTDPQGSTIPQQTEVINGLLVRPVPATLAFTVDAGIAVLFGAARLDGSNAYLLQDKGVAAVAPLTTATNPSGSIRIDLVEVAIASSPETVSDSRDKFNEITGTFSAQNMVKEEELHMQFRVRQGVAGSGIPALVAGWTPLCVVSMPAGALTLDAATLWDVRPLLGDRVNAGGLSAKEVFGDDLWLDLTGPLTAVKGHARVAHKGRWLGGELRRGSPGVDAAFVNFDDAANGSSAGGTTLWTVYLCTPFGLPRWVRYTDASPGGRVPRACRGIPILSDIKPLSDGTPLSAIALPAVFGFAGLTTQEARSIAHGFGDTSAGGGSPGAIDAHGRTIFLNYLLAGGPGIAAEVSPTPTPIQVQFKFKPDVDFPRTAKSLQAAIATACNAVTATPHSISQDSLYLAVAGAPVNVFIPPTGGTFYTTPAVAAGLTRTGLVDIPIRGNTESAGSVPSNHLLTWTTNIAQVSGSAPTFNYASASIIRWEI